MNTYKLIVDINEKVIYGDFPSELKSLISKINCKSIKFDIPFKGRNQNARAGFKKNENGKIYILTTEIKYVKSSKLFSELLKMSVITLNSVVNFNRKLSLNQNEYVQELIHNLTSLNTYNIQDLYSLIPQQILSDNINKQKNVIKSIISEKPNITVDTLLKLIKYNSAMKVEFSVFEKTVMRNPNVQKIEFSIRNVILSILQIFIEDFEKRKIQVTVDACAKRLHIDYDILFVSLYYIFDNALKYCSENSSFKVIFKEKSENLFLVIFEMLSLRIEDNEINKICQKKFRAESAKLLTDEGKGIGMNRVLKTLKLNNAELEIIPRITTTSKTKNNLVFEHNQFIIKFDPTRII